MIQLAKGARVIVAPKAYPRERWRGVVERRTPHGYRVRYDCHGVTFCNAFHASEVTAEAV